MSSLWEQFIKLLSSFVQPSWVFILYFFCQLDKVSFQSCSGTSFRCLNRQRETTLWLISLKESPRFHSAKEDTKHIISQGMRLGKNMTARESLLCYMECFLPVTHHRYEIIVVNITQATPKSRNE